MKTNELELRMKKLKKEQAEKDAIIAKQNKERDDFLRKQKEAEDKRLIEAKRKQDEEAHKKIEEARLKKEAEDKIAKEKRDAELAPDKEKLVKLAEQFSLFPVPEVKSEEAKKIIEMVNQLKTKVAVYIHQNIKNL